MEQVVYVPDNCSGHIVAPHDKFIFFNFLVVERAN